MCTTDFVFDAAEKGIFPSKEELTTLTTLSKLKADAGHMLAPYNSAEHKDSELYRLAPRNVGKSTSIGHEASEGKDDETHSAECISINDVRRRSDSSSGIGDSSEQRIPTDEDIAIRAQAGIAATFLMINDSLMMCYLGTLVAHRRNKDTSIQKQGLHIRDSIKYNRHNQIFEVSNLPGAKLNIKVADAGYSSLYNYESLSAQDRACNIVYPNNKICQAILITFRSIREEFAGLSMVG